MLSVLESCHSLPVGGYHSYIPTTHKILQCGYYWPTIHPDLMILTNYVIVANEKEGF